MKVLGYVRKSPDDKEGTTTSIKNQKDMILKYAKEKGYGFVPIFEDINISGSDRQRKGFLELIKFAKKDEEVKIILVKEQDRFCRDYAFFADTLHDLEIFDVRVFSILRNKFISHEDLGDVLTSVVDSHMIVEGRNKTKQTYNMKKDEGLPPFGAPYGYRNKNKNWYILSSKAKIVKSVVCDYINNINYRETIKALKISKSLYYRIIRNAKKGIYNGYIVYDSKVRDSNKNIVKVRNIKYKGKHEPIITQKEWEFLNNGKENKK